MKRSDEWGTPWELFRKIDAQFNFSLDVCASAENAKLSNYFTGKQNALARSWAKQDCWMNPPYSNVRPWLEKAIKEVNENKHTLVAALLPVCTDTSWWFDLVKDRPTIFLVGRVKFEGAKSTARFPSAIVVYAADSFGRGDVGYWQWKTTDCLRLKGRRWSWSYGGFVSW